MNLTTPLARYNMGMAAWTSLYVATLFAVIYYVKLFKPEGPLLYVLSILPSLPIGGTIIIVLRYMEKADEYVRALLTRRFVLATGVTLFICTFWGFAETIAQAPHVPLYLVYALFWAIFGLITLFTKGGC